MRNCQRDGPLNRRLFDVGIKTSKCQYLAMLGGRRAVIPLSANTGIFRRCRLLDQHLLRPIWLVLKWNTSNICCPYVIELEFSTIVVMSKYRMAIVRGKVSTYISTRYFKSYLIPMIKYPNEKVIVSSDLKSDCI